jgi:hypothetical protein
MKIIAIIGLVICSLSAQQTYHIVTSELTPGVKGNQIVLQLSNISHTQSAENVEVRLVKQSANLKFNTTEAAVKNLNTSEEKETSFSFDVNYAADISKQDTVEFLITDNKTIHLTKQFIFSYISPKEYSLEQNYPNPFNPSTKIRYTIPSVGTSLMKFVQMNVYDILGNEVATLVNEEKPAGYYEVEWNASSVSSGVYFYRLTAGNPSTSSGQRFVSTKKMILLR